MDDIKTYLGIDTNLSFPMEKAMELYPKIKNRIIPLSVTGIAPRTFFHWKSCGIIDYPIGSSEDRVRVKLNMFEFVWLKICILLRDFGLPLNALRTTKESLFEDMYESMIQNKEEFLQFINSGGEKDAEKIKFANLFIPLVERAYMQITEEDRIYTSVISSLINSILILNKQSAVIIYKKDKKTEFLPISYGDFAEFERFSEFFIDLPHIMIQLRPIVDDFLKNSENEKYIEKFEFFNPTEKKILEYIRKKDFIELQLKQIDGKFKITKVEDIDITGTSVSDIRRLIGLNDYSEITLTLRSGNHIHCKRKTKMNPRPGGPGSQ